MLLRRVALTVVGSFAALLLPLAAFAGTTAGPLLTIKNGNITKAIPLFDKFTDGATIALGDLGKDGVSEVIVGAGPGSLPEVRLLRQDGSLVNKFLAFDKTFKTGVIVGVLDADGDGQNDIVAATGPKLGKFVRVFNGFGELKHDWFPIPLSFASSITAATVSSEQTFSVPPPRFTAETTDTKRIEINLSKQRLYAFENGALVHTFLVSTGTKWFPTRPGTYKVLQRSAIMDYSWNYGPGNPNNYNLKNVHWNTRFAAHQLIHEAYWHNDFGKEKSHGCVNATISDAKFIYDWAPLNTPVIITQ